MGGKLVLFGSVLGLSLALTPFPVRMVLMMGAFGYAAYRLSGEPQHEPSWFS